MKRILVGCSLTVALALGSCFAAEPPARTDFSGAWVLDEDKAPHLPAQLESYTLVVKQSDQELTVENKLTGDLGQRQGRSGSGSPGGRQRGGGYPGGYPGVYPGGGDGSVKANWKNDGKVLELSMLRKLQDADRTITSHERWKLAEGGKVLKLERTVESPRGKDKVKLTFRRKDE